MSGNSNAIAVRYAPIGGRRSAGQQMHDRRDPAHTPDYVDTSRSQLNTYQVLRPWTAESIRKEITSERQDKGMQKLRADASIIVSGIVTFGHDAQKVIKSKTTAEQNKIFEKVIEDQAKATGHELLDWSVHRDENAAHAHFTLRGYSPESKPWRKTIANMRHYQDIAAISVESLGIERGYSKESRLKKGENIRDVIHKSVKQLHDDLPTEIESMQLKLSKNERLLDQVQQKLKENTGKNERLEKLISIYEKRAKNAELKLEELKQLLPFPNQKTVKVAQSVESSIFGLRQKVEVKEMGIIDAGEFKKWSLSVSAEIERKNNKIKELEKKATDAEESYKRVSKMNEDLTDQITRLRPATIMSDIPAQQETRTNRERINRVFRNE